VTYENRLPVNYAFGTLSVAAAISDTTLQSSAFATAIPTMSAGTTNYVPIVLQNPSTGVYEIVWVNAHSASSTTVTVVRGKETTAAQAWPSGTLWTVAPTLRDVVLPVTTRSALPADPHVGMRAYIQDEQVQVQYVLNVGWLGASGMAYRATQLLSGNAANVVFTGIPTTLKKVAVAWTARSTAAAVQVDFWMQVNALSGTSYNTNIHTQINATISSGTEVGVGRAALGACTGSTASANNFGSGEVVIPGWDIPHPNLNWHFHSHMWDSAANSFYSQGGGVLFNSGPFNQLTFLAASGNLVAGTEITVYGWG
jgi:hypothetical protein